MTNSNDENGGITRRAGHADPHRSLQPIARSLLAGVAIGFIGILGTLAVLGWSLHNSYRGVAARVDQILTVEEPMNAAAHELEINVLGAGLAVLRYLETGDPVHRARVVNDEADFARFKADYDRLAKGEPEQALGDRIDQLHQRFGQVGRTLMDLRDRRAVMHDQLAAGFDTIDEILDDRIQAAVDPGSAGAEAKFRLSSDIEGDVAEMGTWLGLYLNTPRERYRVRMLDNLQDVRHHLEEFKSISLTPTERAHADRLEQRLHQTAREIHEIIDLYDSQREYETEFISLRNEIDEVLDEGIQDLTRRRLADAAIEASTNIERMRAVGFFLVALSVLAALIAAGAIVRFSVQLQSAGSELETEVQRRRKSEAVRSTLLERLMSAVEAERGRVARELHDQMGQKLSALTLGFETLRRLPGPASQATPQLDRLQGIADELIDDVHAIAWELRPAALDDFGLHGALSSLVEYWKASSDLEIDFDCRLGNRRMPRQVETTLYRVAQEALTNVARHAGARAVSVVFTAQPDQVRLVVEDDGCGFEPNRSVDGVAAEDSLGLAGMGERLALAGGTLEVESAPGKGTTVIASIPIGPESAIRPESDPEVAA
ncbi:MAG: hypothetical protein JRH16_16825 [Deltaproteobacteria bacterium]|nr:hypothetical protein [Deltaproteobacteria bacterium]MBW2362049.1 hypothetical protein [Deltaproteobacteria bacterium]